MNAFFRQIVKGDRWIWAIYVLLIICSCIITYSAMSRLVLGAGSATLPILRHILFLVAGVIVVVCVQIVDFRAIRLFSYPLLLLAFAMLVYVAVAGSESGAAKRFTSFGQPSEFVKLFLIMTMADVIMRIRKCKVFPARVFWTIMVIVMFMLVLVFMENLSSAALIFATIVAMMLVGGIDARRVLALVAIVVVLAGGIISVAYIVPEETFMEVENPVVRSFKRIYTWRARIDRRFDNNSGHDTEYYVDDDNIQEAYAKIAICRGGWAPHGPGSSLQRNYLPEAYSDFVYSIACEEWGFPMGLLLMTAYLVLLWRAIRYARRSGKIYRSVLVFGCAFVIAIQAGLHIAVSVGLMPVTGQTLPLISKGGTSIIVVSACFGLMIKATATPATAGTNVTADTIPALPEATAEPRPDTEKPEPQPAAPQDEDDDESITIMEE